MADTAGVLDETCERLHQADPEAGADDLPCNEISRFAQAACRAKCSPDGPERRSWRVGVAGR
jgi:hypothetical protein